MQKDIANKHEIDDQKANNLVVNYHMNEACNYRCHYCYATWENDGAKELHLNMDKVERLLRMIFDGFVRENPPAKAKIRLNLVGGEPSLSPNFTKIIDTAIEIGFTIGIVTNGSHLTDTFVEKYAEKMDVIGISVDAIDSCLMKKIGRATCSEKTMNMEKLTALLSKVRVLNPGCKIKINTVVNQFNYFHDMRPFIHTISPDKWKILRVLPNVNPTAAITSEQYRQFLETHKELSEIIYPEDNDAMKGSYIMVDPLGRFFDNTTSCTEGAYRYSAPILDVGLQEAFSMVNFDRNKFETRYDQNALLAA
jgi:radical S-adenosyl methionine domain-containing protein 2